MKIRRRVKDGDKYKEAIEEVTLVKRNSRTVWVKLSNGDVIKRKNRDIVDNTEKGEK